jgi:uroporphyrinogen-III decarboxylase
MPENKLELAKQRQERLRKAVNYEPVDRIPFTFLGPAYAPRSVGVSLAEFCTNPDAAIGSTLDAMDALGDVDAVNNMVAGYWPCLLSSLWLSKIAVPGIELPPNELWQVREEEVMKVEDYDLIINKGYEAFLGTIIPKVHKMDLFAKNNAWMAANLADTPRRYFERGYAILTSMNTTIPFEPFCGGRSMEKFILDCFRMPDKVKAAMDVAQPFYVNLGIAVTSITGVLGTWVGGWRAASAMVSPKIWDKLVFPYYYDMVTKFMEKGILCVLHFDQNWDRDIARFLDFPKGCVFSPDGATDIRRAKKILGDHMAFLGDVPASILAAGTPDDVYKYVSELIRDLGPRGLIMNSGCDMPHNTPKANAQALVAATREYGTYVKKQDAGD